MTKTNTKDSTSIQGNSATYVTCWPAPPGAQAVMDVLTTLETGDHIDVLWRADGSFMVHFCESYEISVSDFGVAIAPRRSGDRAQLCTEGLADLARILAAISAAETVAARSHG